MKKKEFLKGEISGAFFALSGLLFAEKMWIPSVLCFAIAGTMIVISKETDQ